MVLLGRAVKERLGIHEEHKRCQKTKDRQKLTNFWKDEIP